MSRPKVSGKTVRTVSTSLFSMSCSSCLRSSRPGMTRIVAYRPRLCHPAAVPSSPSRTIVAWTLYDFANSAFAAVVLATIYPAYYANAVVGNATGHGDFLWGTAISTAMVIGALTSPLLGGVADHAGARKTFLMGFTVVCIVTTALMATVSTGMVLWGWVLAVAGAVAQRG